MTEATQAVTGADIIAKARSYKGKFTDGPDVPMLAHSVGQAFPDLAKYSTEAGEATSWCGIFVAYVMTQFGIHPPSPDANDVGFMWVDRWLTFGQVIPVGQEQPGDIALFLGNPSPHHITFVADGGKYVGGNQSDGVTETTFRRPDAIRRAPGSITQLGAVSDDAHSEIAIGATGVAVVELQALLGLLQTGTFDLATDIAVRAYQASRGLDVDGEVGVKTWGALLSRAAAKPAVASDSLSADTVAKITALARISPARTGWSNGSMPVGCVNGLAVSYGIAYRGLKASASPTLAMARPLGGANDALVLYGDKFTDPVALLRANFELLFGSAMRESSGNYSEGRDTSARNTSADTAEAGLFQQSYNSFAVSRDPELPKLLTQWRTSNDDGLLPIFREGVNDKQTQDFGSGDGALFQHLCKSKPLFAVYCAAIGQRVLDSHWGPISRHEAQMRPEVVTLLRQVETIIDAMPAPQKPIDGEVIHPPQPPALASVTPLLSLVGMLLTSLLENSKMTSPTSDIGAKITADIPKLVAFFQDPVVQKLLSGGAVTLQELLSLPAELRQILTGQPAPPLSLPPPISTTPDAAKPDASPLMASIDKIMLKLSGGGLAASILAMLPADGLGAPFNWGSAPSTSGTAAVVIPAASGILSAVGGWSGLIKIGAKIFALIPK